MISISTGWTEDVQFITLVFFWDSLRFPRTPGWAKLAMINGKHIQLTQPFAIPGSGTFSFFFCTVGKQQTEEKEKAEI